MRRFATNDGDAVTEFKTMVKALHKVGIEVILDVVYNHTGGRWLSVLAKKTYYLTDYKGYDMNISGCGNTRTFSNFFSQKFFFYSKLQQNCDFRLDCSKPRILGRRHAH
jgi:pullulanase/glycogen debranching enzyme